MEVEYCGMSLPGSPLDIKIYDATKIQVSDVRGFEVNKLSEFTIDASAAGEGQLEISVNEGMIKNNVKQIRTGCYSVSFMPLKQDFYTVDCKFNGETVPGNKLFY